MIAIERRQAAASALEVAPARVSGTSTLSGRAIVYGALSQDLGGFRERFVPGSVRLAPGLLVLFNHDPGLVLGRVDAGTAKVTDDGSGIRFSVDAPDTQWARDLAVSMRRGDVRQCSFSFRTLEDDFYYDNGIGTVVREVFDAEVLELSIVSMPAYPDTDAGIT